MIDLAAVEREKEIITQNVWAAAARMAAAMKRKASGVARTFMTHYRLARMKNRPRPVRRADPAMQIRKPPGLPPVNLKPPVKVNPPPGRQRRRDPAMQIKPPPGIVKRRRDPKMLIKPPPAPPGQKKHADPTMKIKPPPTIKKGKKSSLSVKGPRTRKATATPVAPTGSKRKPSLKRAQENHRKNVFHYKGE